MPKLRTDLIILLFAILIGFLTKKGGGSKYFKILPWFLLLILLVELVGEYFQRRSQNNLLLFNLFTVVEFLFYALFLQKNMPKMATKKIITLVIFIIPIASLINIFFVQGPAVFHTYTYSIGSLILVILGFIYFFQLFKERDRGYSFDNPDFWIGIGILFYFICSISVIGILNYISFFPKSVRNNMQQILIGINSVFYLILIIAFLCKLIPRKSISNL